MEANTLKPIERVIFIGSQARVLHELKLARDARRRSAVGEPALVRLSPRSQQRAARRRQAAPPPSGGRRGLGLPEPCSYPADFGPLPDDPRCPRTRIRPAPRSVRPLLVPEGKPDLPGRHQEPARRPPITRTASDSAAEEMKNVEVWRHADRTPVGHHRHCAVQGQRVVLRPGRLSTRGGRLGLEPRRHRRAQPAIIAPSRSCAGTDWKRRFVRRWPWTTPTPRWTCSSLCSTDWRRMSAVAEGIGSQQVNVGGRGSDCLLPTPHHPVPRDPQNDDRQRRCRLLRRSKRPSPRSTRSPRSPAPLVARTTETWHTD